MRAPGQQEGERTYTGSDSEQRREGSLFMSVSK